MEIITKIIIIILALTFATGVVALGVVVARFNLKRRDVKRAYESATSQQIDQIAALIESIGSEPSVGGILINAKSQLKNERCVVHIPDGIKDFPWSGHAYKVKTDSSVSFTPTDEHCESTELLGHKYSFLATPRKLTRNGKARNIFDPKRYVKLCPELHSALEDISAKYPMELLSYILSNGSIEFDPIDQLRIGTSAAWVQEPEWKYCPTCKKRMVLIIQLPGTSIHKKAFHECTFFLFGCKSHPQLIECVEQYT